MMLGVLYNDVSSLHKSRNKVDMDQIIAEQQPLGFVGFEILIVRLLVFRR
jgi:hypothetical protein